MNISKGNVKALVRNINRLYTKFMSTVLSSEKSGHEICMMTHSVQSEGFQTSSKMPLGKFIVSETNLKLQ